MTERKLTSALAAVHFWPSDGLKGPMVLCGKIGPEGGRYVPFAQHQVCEDDVGRVVLVLRVQEESADYLVRVSEHYVARLIGALEEADAYINASALKQRNDRRRVLAKIREALKAKWIR